MQSADISWHGLEGLDDSIMDTVAALSFGGDFGAAHSYMDFGGDILGVTQWNTSFANGWYDLLALQYSTERVIPRLRELAPRGQRES